MPVRYRRRGDGTTDSDKHECAVVGNGAGFGGGVFAR
jgi:hypothetical protein